MMLAAISSSNPASTGRVGKTKGPMRTMFRLIAKPPVPQISQIRPSDARM